MRCKKSIKKGSKKAGNQKRPPPNAEVYALFGLTQAEVKLLEGAV